MRHEGAADPLASDRPQWWRRAPMADRQQTVLRVQPQAIPALRAAFGVARDQVDAALIELSRRGYISAPWLGDETSSGVAGHYTMRAMEAPDSSYQSLTAYRAELERVHDTLQQMEYDYRRGEGDKAARLGRMA
jgi:hypothetical protein